MKIDIGTIIQYIMGDISHPFDRMNIENTILQDETTFKIWDALQDTAKSTKPKNCEDLLNHVLDIQAQDKLRKEAFSILGLNKNK